MAVTRISSVPFSNLSHVYKLKQENRKVEPVFHSSTINKYNEKEEEAKREPRYDKVNFHTQLEEAYHKSSKR